MLTKNGIYKYQTNSSKDSNNFIVNFGDQKWGEEGSCGFSKLVGVDGTKS
jgi:hypothetical protein